METITSTSVLPNREWRYFTDRRPIRLPGFIVDHKDSRVKAETVAELTGRAPLEE